MHNLEITYRNGTKATTKYLRMDIDVVRERQKNGEFLPFAFTCETVEALLDEIEKLANLIADNPDLVLDKCS